MTTAIIVEDIIAIAGIPIAVIPATAKADVVKAIAAVARVIAVERRIWVAVIRAIAVIIIADAHIIDTTRQPDRSKSQG
jgi:hypothetical protein